jgi:hypothetical protein
VNALLEAALERAREGACVIPIWWTDPAGACACPKGACCPSPGKHPLTPRGLDDATRDEPTIYSWYRRWPGANVAVRTDDVPRIDIDVPEIAELLAADPELLATTEVVRTPREGGGLHVAVACRGVRTAKLTGRDGQKLGDLKATGGYVLVPPSRIGTREYTRLNALSVPPVPVDDPTLWIGDRLALYGHPLADAPAVPAYRDQAAKVPVGGRHAALTSHAGWLWVEGMAPAAFTASLHGINEAICSPPLPKDEVDAIARHFIERRERRATANGHDPVTGPATALRRITVQALDEWLQGEDPPLDVVIGDGADGAILPIDGKGFIAGSTGIGKTNLILRLGRCLAEGTPFLGVFPVPTPRIVLHIALEGSRRGLRRRLRKVWEGSSQEARDRYHLALLQLNLANEPDVEGLEQLLADVRPHVLIIDPLRNAHTWDENSSQDVAQLTSVLDSIIARHGCALVAAHHDRKKPPLTKRDGGTDRIRGSTALAGWLSFCLSVEKDPTTPDTLVAEWTKVRDAEEGLPDLLLTFERTTLDFTATERTAASKVGDEDILTPVFQSGAAGMRGPQLVEVVRSSTGASPRTVKDRLRQLVKDGRVVEYQPPQERTRAKWYRLPEEDEE